MSAARDTGSGLADMIESAPIHRIARYRELRWLCLTARLGHRLFPVIRAFVPRDGLIEVPFGNRHALSPACWVTPYTAVQLFFGSDALPERRVYRTLIERAPAGVVVDVGANLGAYVLLTRQASAARIIAYEPSPLAAGILRRMVRSNGLRDVEVRAVACGARSGTVSLQEGVNSFIGAADGAPHAAAGFDELCRETQASFTRVERPEVTLDDDLGDEPAVAILKIDCEGYEHQVLLGARRMLARHRPAVFLELHPRFIRRFGSTPEEVCALLRDASYDLEGWTFERRSGPSRLGRLAGRYMSGSQRYRDDRELMIALKDTASEQVYVLATPKERAGTST
jgi:FkbM family methyltransferase